MKLLAMFLIVVLMLAIYTALNFVYSIQDCMLTTEIRDCVWLTRK